MKHFWKLKNLILQEKYNWSHPIVYFAGCKTGWSTLNDSNQYNAINQFRKNYAELLIKLEEGLDLSIDHTETEEFELKKFDSNLFKQLRKNMIFEAKTYNLD